MYKLSQLSGSITNKVSFNRVVGSRPVSTIDPRQWNAIYPNFRIKDNITKKSKIKLLQNSISNTLSHKLVNLNE